MVFYSSSPNGPRHWSTFQTPSDFDIPVAHFTVHLAGFCLFQASHLQYYSWRGDTELPLYNPASAAAAAAAAAAK